MTYGTLFFQLSHRYHVVGTRKWPRCQLECPSAQKKEWRQLARVSRPRWYFQGWCRNDFHAHMLQTCVYDQTTKCQHLTGVATTQGSQCLPMDIPDDHGTFLCEIVQQWQLSARDSWHYHQSHRVQHERHLQVFSGSHMTLLLKGCLCTICVGSCQEQAIFWTLVINLKPWMEHEYLQRLKQAVQK